MVLESKQTTVAYRCPHCGAGVLSMVNVFSLGGDMIKLKCDCHKSEMTVVKQSDGKVRLTVPCIACPKPHTFVLSPTVFFGKEEFFLQCPYSDINIGFIGEENHVKAELARSELELLELMEKSGISDLSMLRGEEEDEEWEDDGCDPEMLQAVLFVLHELDNEKKIYCRCEATDEYDPEKYEFEVSDGGVTVKCRDCGAKSFISAGNYLDSYAFLDAESLRLE